MGLVPVGVAFCVGIRIALEVFYFFWRHSFYSRETTRDIPATCGVVLPAAARISTTQMELFYCTAVLYWVQYMRWYSIFYCDGEKVNQ